VPEVFSHAKMLEQTFNDGKRGIDDGGLRENNNVKFFWTVFKVIT
jgi:hypothetical protein